MFEFIKAIQKDLQIVKVDIEAIKAAILGESQIALVASEKAVIPETSIDMPVIP